MIVIYKFCTFASKNMLLLQAKQLCAKNIICYYLSGGYPAEASSFLAQSNFSYSDVPNFPSLRWISVGQIMGFELLS